MAWDRDDSICDASTSEPCRVHRRAHVDARSTINKDYRYYALHKGNVEMRGLNLDQLRTFAGVVEHKSFSAAAERLGISQPAVSLQVRQLERRFGVKLIERVGRNATPTPAGAQFVAHARNVQAAPPPPPGPPPPPPPP